MTYSIIRTTAAMAVAAAAVLGAIVGVAPARAAPVATACEAPAPGQGTFTWAQGTIYTDEADGGAARAYHLIGCTPYGVDDLAPMGLSGRATLLVAYQGQEIALDATGLYLDGVGGYRWTFAPRVQQDGAISAVTGADGGDVTLQVHPADGANRESADLRFGLADSQTFDPDAVRIRTVVFTTLNAPYIDVFRRVGHTSS